MRALACPAPAVTRLSNLQLFALAVLIWGTTWHAIVYQLAEATPEFGVATRFSLAAAAVLALAAWHRAPMRFKLRAHALRYLRPGDEMTVEIEGLGTLTNPVVGPDGESS